ncbi:MAG: hypothetical protein IPG76_19705 [Acidobacteria bacterium]|nr:hypothetical protein [Acidobacteriota bacterium]
MNFRLSNRIVLSGGAGLCARYPGLPAFAEKCPQYLLLDYKCHEKEDVEGAKICTVNIYGSKINPA